MALFLVAALVVEKLAEAAESGGSPDPHPCFLRGFLSRAQDFMAVGSRDRRDFGRDKAQDQVLAQEYATAALQY